MKKLILALIAFFAVAVLVSPGARAETFIAKGEHTTIVLTTEPCTSEKVKKAHPRRDLKKFGTAKVTYMGKLLEACFTANFEESVVEIVDETGDGGQVPMQYFRPVDPV